MEREQRRMRLAIDNSGSVSRAVLTNVPFGWVRERQQMFWVLCVSDEGEGKGPLRNPACLPCEARAMRQVRFAKVRCACASTARLSLLSWAGFFYLDSAATCKVYALAGAAKPSATRPLLC